jgi:hypothetical protein
MRESKNATWKRFLLYIRRVVILFLLVSPCAAVILSQVKNKTKQFQKYIFLVFFGAVVIVVSFSRQVAVCRRDLWI